MKYEEMSDFEINQAVATALGMDVSGATEENNMMYDYVRDYCNNPSDAWPIIFSSRTMLNPYCADELWKAEVPCGFDGLFKEYATCYHRNPLRAAMIVFLMMQDVE